jgi:hypothetical protein
MKLQKKNIPILLFFLLSLLAFFQVSFFIHPIKYDAIDCFYPWRFYIGECLQNFQFPYWNPYVDLGYPIHADPSSGAWYPMVWIIGFFNGYTIYSIGFEFWIHVFFAGIGFYHLCKKLKFEQNYATIAGVAYMLSGIFIGNAQHLPYIISACWLPFVLNFYFRLVKESNYFNALKAGFFLFLMITGGYPAFTIILFYLLVIFFVIYFIQEVKKKDNKSIFQFLIRHFLFLVYTILLSLVMLVAIYQVSGYLSRLGDFELEQALFSPFSPNSFVSFILPLATATKTEFFHSDLSMRNAYFGIFTFILFILGFFSKKPLEIKVLFFFGLFALTAAVGEYLPVREFLFKYIPMMNTFRFPSVFRLFFIIGAILSALYYLKIEVENKETISRKLKIAFLIFIGVFISIIVFARLDGYLSLTDLIKNKLFKADETITLSQNLALQSFIQIGMLTTFLIVILKIKDKAKLISTILIFTCLDLFVTTQLNAPYTVFYDSVNAKEASLNVSVLPKGFNSNQNKTLEEAEHLSGIGTPFWKNMNIFQKVISADGFNSFSFSSYENLESEYPQLFQKIKKNKVITLTDSIFSVDQMNHYKKDSLFTSNQLFFTKRDYDYFKKQHFQSHVTDIAYIQSLDAANFQIVSSTKSKTLLTLYQKEYKGWSVKVNGENTPIYKSNLNFMSIVIPEGKNKIHFEYSNPVLKIAFMISCFSLLILIVLTILELRNRRNLIDKKI